MNLDLLDRIAEASVFIAIGVALLTLAGTMAGWLVATR